MLEIYPSNFEDFLRESKKGNVVPLVRSVLADLHTPVGAFMRVADSSPKAFLFESIEGGEKIARYSFLGANPFMHVRSLGGKTLVEKDGETNFIPNVSLVDFLRDHFAKNKLAVRPNLPPLAGGAVGFFGYKSVRWFEPILDDGKFSDQADASWMFFKTLLAFDRLKQTIEIIVVVLTDEAENDIGILRKLYDQALAESLRIENLLATDLSELHTVPKENLPSSAAFLTNWAKPDFLASVETIKENIFAGNCYQAVISQQFKRQTSAEALTIYRALRMTNPSPYMFFLKLGAETLIGASPEMLVKCRGEKLDYCPIAGTRKRGVDEAEDWILGEDLRSDAKEIAEHLMLVDLGRNDLGKVAEYGSVEVSELMKIERYSHVQHLVTTLKADLRKGLDRFDALASCFPAGTVTGAPKVRAMQIIDSLEPNSRGVYAGAVGYMDYAENLDTCIAIRTIEMRENFVTIQAGAGIVADSVPEKEYEETLNKARALVKAIEIAEKGL